MNLKLVLLFILSLVHARRTHHHSTKKNMPRNALCTSQMCDKCTILTLHGGLNDSRSSFICGAILSRPSCCPMSTILFLA